MVIGLFFGSFNPIHNGHLIIANLLPQLGYVDKTLLIVSPQSPFKKPTELANFEHRLTMCRIATENSQFIEVSDIEAKLPTPSFTYRTLQELEKYFPHSHFRIIIGSDSYITLPMWKNFQQLRKYEFLIYQRPNFKVHALYSKNHLIVKNTPLLHISSTMIRKFIRQNVDISYLVPDNVKKYIFSHRLYTQ